MESEKGIFLQNLMSELIFSSLRMSYKKKVFYMFYIKKKQPYLRQWQFASLWSCVIVLNHRMPLQQGDQRSLPWQQHWRMVPNHNWSAPRMSALPHPLQHLLREDNGWCTWRPWRNSQYRRRDNYKPTFCWWHWRPSWTRARAGQVGKSPWRGLHSIWNADHQCREDPVDDE